MPRTTHSRFGLTRLKYILAHSRAKYHYAQIKRHDNAARSYYVPFHEALSTVWAPNHGKGPSMKEVAEELAKSDPKYVRHLHQLKRVSSYAAHYYQKAANLAQKMGFPSTEVAALLRKAQESEALNRKVKI